MKPTVYLETTIIGYLASKPSRDLVTAANQQITHEWWNERRDHFDLYVSELVIEECSAGDAQHAQKRLNLVADLPLLQTSDEAKSLAKKLVKRVPLPKKAKADASHIAIASVSGMDYLLTWNCRHIANASLRPRIEDICRAVDFHPPIICTPQELLEG